MRRTRLIAAAAFTAIATSSAAAQMRMNQQGSGRPISFAFGGGASVPVGNYKDALKAGWNGQGSLIFNIPGVPVAFRADLHYNKFTFKHHLAFSSDGTGTITTNNHLTPPNLGGLANIPIPFHMGPVS